MLSKNVCCVDGSHLRQTGLKTKIVNPNFLKMPNLFSVLVVDLLVD